MWTAYFTEDEQARVTSDFQSTHDADETHPQAAQNYEGAEEEMRELPPELNEEEDDPWAADGEAANWLHGQTTTHQAAPAQQPQQTPHAPTPTDDDQNVDEDQHNHDDEKTNDQLACQLVNTIPGYDWAGEQSTDARRQTDDVITIMPIPNDLVYGKKGNQRVTGSTPSRGKPGILRRQTLPKLQSHS